MVQVVYEELKGMLESSSIIIPTSISHQASSRPTSPSCVREAPRARSTHAPCPSASRACVYGTTLGKIALVGVRYVVHHVSERGVGMHAVQLHT